MLFRSTPTVAERLAYLPARPDAPIIEKDGNFDQDMSYDTTRIRRELGFKEVISERAAAVKTVTDFLSARS